MKKTAVTIIVLAMMVIVGALAFAGGKQEASGAKAPAKASQITIGYAVFNVGVDSYETYHFKTFMKEAKKLGVKVIALNAQGDAARQINQIETLMQRKPSVLVVWPVNGKAVVPVLKKAHDAGFKIVIANSPVAKSGFPYITAFAGPNNTQEGRDAANMMISAFKQKGITGTKRIVELNGLPGYVTEIQRAQGFKDVIKQHPSFKLLASEPTNWNRAKATTAMEDLLVRYPHLQGVYAEDDNIAVGAINALKEKGFKAGQVIVTSACIFGAGYDAMKEGWIQGTNYQFAGLDAIHTVKVAVQVAEGKSVPFNDTFKSPEVTPQNMSKFQKPPY